MDKTKQRNKVLNIILIAGIIIGLALTDLSSGVWLGIFSTIALLSGFANVYFTTKRSTKFIIPDMMWIFFTLLTLVLTLNYSDMFLYFFYIGVGFYQYYNWKKNKGYPTKEHREAIRNFGVTKYHRKSFKLLPEQLKLAL